MDATSSATATHIHPTASCCSQEQASPLIKKIDLICRIALGIIAGVLAPKLALIALAAGLLAGAGYAAMRLWQQKPLFPAGESKPVCAQGYMDFLSGMRFPPEIGSLATTTFIAAHMRHDPTFYVPFCGFFIGLWLGREAVTSLKNLSGYNFRVFAPSKMAEKCCCG